MKKLGKKLTVLLAVVMLSMTLFATLGSSSASAVTPAQTTSTGSVNVLYGDVNTFWRNNFTSWGWSAYYRTPSVRYYSSSVYQCGGWWYAANLGFACSGANIGNIWISTTGTQGLHNRYGDYGSGVILAHEVGHEIQYYLGWTSRTAAGAELFADCLAGMYTRYGITVSRKLNNNDYWEGYNALASIGSTSHGSAAQRTAWYQYGYNSYNLYSCGQALT